MQTTPHYALQQPQANDTVDIVDLITNNTNIIDSQMYQNAQNGIPYAVDTSTTVNTLTITLTPAPTAYVDGFAVCVKVANTITGAATLNVNGLGAVTLKNGDGSAVGSGDLVAGVPVTFRYVGGSTPAFIASGSGGLSGTGNATAADVVAPFTFTSGSGKVQTGTIPTVAGGNTINPSASQQTAVAPNSYVQNAIVVAGVSFDASKLLTGTTIAGTAGTMPNNGTLNIAPSTTAQSIPAGYTQGGTVGAVPGTATPAQILTGYSASGANGIDMGGSMPNLGGLTYNASTSTQTSGAGYTSGVTVNPVPGNATAAQIVSGYTASSANGINISGTAAAKLTASGSATTDGNGDVVVSGLAFQPRVVIVEYSNFNTSYPMCVYCADASTSNYAEWNASDLFQASASGLVNGSGFTMPTGKIGVPVNWYAYN